jgi:hypothetical protein
MKARIPFLICQSHRTTYNISGLGVCVNFAGSLNIAVEKPISEWVRAIAPRFARLAPAQNSPRSTT